MKVIVSFLILLPYAFGNPVFETSERFIDPREYDPYYKRFIPMELGDGTIEIVDLLANASTFNIQPHVSTSDVEYDLYTRNNINTPYIITNNNLDALSRSTFNPNKLSVFVAHGWTNHRNSEINTMIRSALWGGNYDVNLFIVDWYALSSKDYLTAKSSVANIGAVIGEFINDIQKAYGIGGSSFVLIGHSLGAHVVGGAGAVVNDKVGLIIGLDPAGPLFSILNTKERLDKTDGKVVEVMHTNGAILGFGSSIGHIDYHPNGGLTQPGCPLDVTGICAHAKAYKYLVESFERGDVFQARKCSSYSSYKLGLCIAREKSVMGILTGSGSSEGDYYLNVNSNSPFGQS